jgi:hypothetical protein
MTVELPQYQCHKIVNAAQIALITPVPAEGETGASEFHDSILTLALPGTEIGTTDIAVDAAWMARHRPVEGGYYVSYNDGEYASFSPPAPFEGGYRPLSEVEDERKKLAAMLRGDNQSKALEQANDMLGTYQVLLDLIREALGVSIEPHQTLSERILVAVGEHREAMSAQASGRIS